MSSFYFLNNAYIPGTAMTNRMLAYVRGLSELGINTNLVFFFPDEKRSKIEFTFPFITIDYLWENEFSTNTFAKAAHYVLHIIRFLRRLKKGDYVYMYNMEDVYEFVQLKKGIKVFIERTEHPSVYPLGSKLYSPSIKHFIRTIKRGSGLIVISNALKQYFVEKGVPEKKIQIVNIMVDPNRFIGLEYGNSSEKYIAYCGTASNNKDGVDELIRSFSLFSKRHPDYKLVIIGRVPSRHEEFGNQRLAADLGISDQVVFTGIVSPEVIPHILSGASILALDRPDNTQARYGFPTKLGEYLLSGRPVVVTAVGDIPLYLKDRENALVANPQDPQSFADKLSWVADNPEQASVIGRNGHDLAKKEFNYITETRKLINFLYKNKETGL